MLALLLASNLVAITNADLQLKLSAVKPAILVGEFTKVRLEWVPLKDIKVLLDAEEVLIDDGSGFRPHLEADMSESTTVSLPTPLHPGERHITEYMIGLVEVDVPSDLSGMEAAAAGLQFAFNRPGRYRVRARYTDAQSNDVVIDVAEPSGRDAELLQALRRQPLVLTWMGDTEDELMRYGDELIDRYTGHPYLARLILRHCHSYERPAFDRLRSLDLSESAFEDERLLLLAENGLMHMGETWQRQTLDELIRKFPGSLAAQKARVLLDNQAPTLALTPSPGRLWPPNHRLEPITVSVQVSDNRDPNPMVKLESITCDDQCDPTQDVGDADFGTDDRRFFVRAERSGQGPGRTYTITYTAQDFAGNKATTTTTVVVPHDQGKKTK